MDSVSFSEAIQGPLDRHIVFTFKDPSTQASGGRYACRCLNLTVTLLRIA